MAATCSCGDDQFDNDSIVLNRLAVGWAAVAAGVLKDAVEILLVVAAGARAVFRKGDAKGYWGDGYSLIRVNSPAILAGRPASMAGLYGLRVVQVLASGQIGRGFYAKELIEAVGGVVAG